MPNLILTLREGNTMKNVKDMTREELTDEISDACGYTGDCECAELADLRERVEWHRTALAESVEDSRSAGA